MSDLYTGPKPPASEADNLRQLERDVFDAVGAITTAIGQGLVQAAVFQLAGPPGAPALAPTVTIFLPPEPGGKPVPKRFACPEAGPSFLHCLHAAGEMLDRQMRVHHASTGEMQAYIEQRAAIEKLRGEKPRIIVPGASRS